MRKKILIIDDSSMSRRILRRILESVGHEIIEAGEMRMLKEMSSMRKEIAELKKLLVAAKNDDTS